MSRKQEHNLGAPEAVLVYPAPLAHPVDCFQRGIHVRTLVYDLADDLGAAGVRFVQQLFPA